MKKTIKLENKKTIKIDTSWAWPYIYQEYFGHDVIPDLVPLIDTVIEAFTSLMNGEDIDQEGLSDRLYATESTTIINIIWALAKNADDDIPDVKEWAKQFDRAPLDIILPEVLTTLAQTMMSTKKAELLQAGMTAAASHLIRSLSPQQTEG